MKPEELQIGDWVNVFGIPKQIEGIREFRNGDEVAYYDGDNGNFIENVTPIPLTSEILEKNGFYETVEGIFKFKQLNKEEDNYDYYIIIDLIIPIASRIISNHKPFNEIEGEIKYVHELQHVFKLFKIDKKIEL